MSASEGEMKSQLDADRREMPLIELFREEWRRDPINAAELAAWGKPLFEAEHRQFVESCLALPDEADDRTRKAHRGYTLYRGLAKNVGLAAMQHSLSIGASIDEFETLAFRGIDIVQNLRFGLIANFNETHWAECWNFWRHRREAPSMISTAQRPYINRSVVELSATGYLQLPYRVIELERIIVDVLVACELFDFGEHFATDPKFRKRCIPGQSSFPYSGLVLGYLGGQLRNGVILLGIAAVAFNSSQIIGETAAGWIGGVMIALFALSFLVATLAAPYAFWMIATIRRGAGRQMAEMLRVYAELDTDGAISARRIREATSRAADLGVVWPPPLFAILDDNIARCGRL